MAKQKKSATRRILLILGVLLGALVLIGAVGWATGFLGGGEEGVAVEASEAERRTVTQVVTAFGRVQPEVEIVISPDVPGEIVELPVREGDRVQKGALLARVKPDDYIAQAQQAQAGVSQAQARLAESRASLNQAEIDFNRSKSLYEREVISESTFQTAKSTYEQAQAQLEAAKYAVESAQAQRREAGEQIAKTEIYSPMTGVVSKLSVEEGERVVGTSQMAGTEMMRIARLDQMELEVDVNENDVVNVALGDSAAVEVDAYPDQTFRGVVMEIANSARVSGEGTQEQVTNFPVKVRITEAHNLDVGLTEAEGAAGQPPARPARAQEEGALPTAAKAPTFRPGMSGAVDISTQTVKNAVAVPIQAVTVRDFNQMGENQEGKPEAGGGDEAGEAEEGGEVASSEESGGSESRGENGEGGGPRAEDLRKVVFLIADDGTAKMTEVQTGISDDTHVQVTSGLDGGEMVITGPYRAVSRMLRPGMDVHVEAPRGPRGSPVAAR